MQSRMFQERNGLQTIKSGVGLIVLWPLRIAPEWKANLPKCRMCEKKKAVSGRGTHLLTRREHNELRTKCMIYHLPQTEAHAREFSLPQMHRFDKLPHLTLLCKCIHEMWCGLVLLRQSKWRYHEIELRACLGRITVHVPSRFLSMIAVPNTTDLTQRFCVVELTVGVRVNSRGLSHVVVRLVQQWLSHVLSRSEARRGTLVFVSILRGKRAVLSAMPLPTPPHHPVWVAAFGTLAHGRSEARHFSVSNMSGFASCHFRYQYEGVSTFETSEKITWIFWSQIFSNSQYISVAFSIFQCLSEVIDTVVGWWTR